MARDVLVLGGGLAGISASYHIGHDRCTVLEQDARPFGHISVDQRDGYTWDPGPHVSFTKNEYVRDLFAASVGGAFDEYEVTTGNYYHGHWIEHPAQTALHQIPEPLRDACLQSFLETRRAAEQRSEEPPTDYATWLERAFGPVFAREFPEVYTRKYWTRDARELTLDWLGNRVFYPSVEDVVAGSKGPLGRATHYITKVRYPRHGGYQAFAASMLAGCNVEYGAQVSSIDLAERVVRTADGRAFRFQRLVNTIALPRFIELCADVPEHVRDAARALACSQLLLVNVRAPHPTVRPENWIYVYDDDKLSTRIHCTEKLTPANAPPESTGIQVEVYFSRYRPLPVPPSEVAARVQDELREMGLLRADIPDAHVGSHVRHAPWANVIFDHDTRPALDRVWTWLESHGLSREDDDVHPTTDWAAASTGRDVPAGRLMFAGRFGQWKYFWTDDCVLRGRELGRRLAQA